MTNRNDIKRRQAVNAIVYVAIGGAVMCMVIAIIDLSSGGGLGWLLLGLGVLPLGFAMMVRKRMLRN